MRYAALTERIKSDGSEAWALHTEASAAAEAGEDVVVLSIGDPDLATPIEIADAAIEAIRAGDTHYVDPLGRAALRDAVAARASKRFGCAVGRDEVIFLCGAQNALYAAFQCVVGPDDEVLIPEPAYVTYEATARAAGADVRWVACPPETGFRLDAAAIDAACGPRTRALLINTPANPTGVVASRAELEAVAEVARARDLWVVADEVYDTLAFDRPHVSMASIAGMAERTITVGSVSKSHAMTGWRAGWAIAPPEAVAHMERLFQAMLYGLPGFVQEAARAALEDATSAAEISATFERRRDVLLDALGGAPKMRLVRPEGGMFVLADIRETGLSGRDYARALYDATGVAVLAADAFGASAAGFVRIGFTLGETQLRAACARIAAFQARL